MCSAVVGEPVVEHCLSGLNACVMAYGQTGAGEQAALRLVTHVRVHANAQSVKLRSPSRVALPEVHLRMS